MDPDPPNSTTDAAPAQSAPGAAGDTGPALERSIARAAAMKADRHKAEPESAKLPPLPAGVPAPKASALHPAPSAAVSATKGSGVKQGSAQSRDPDGSMDVEQVSESPPPAQTLASEEPPPVLVKTGKAPVVIETRPPMPPRMADVPEPASNASVRPYGALSSPSSVSRPPRSVSKPTLGSSVRTSPPPKPRRRRLAPKHVALFGGLLGLGVMASLLAIVVHLDGRSHQFGPPAAKAPAKGASADEDEPSNKAKHTRRAKPGELKAEPEKQDEPIEGPFRVIDMKGRKGIRIVKGKMGKKSLVKTLSERKIPKKQIYRIIKSFGDPKLFNRTRSRDKYVVAISYGSKKIRGFEYQRSVADVWQAKENDQGLLEGKKLDLHVEEKRITKGFRITTSLRAAIVDAGLDPSLMKALEKMLDGRFHPNHMRKGASVKLVLKAQTVLGRFAAYKDIQAFEYRRKGKEPIRLYHLNNIGGGSGYFDNHGKAPYNGGWRSPVKFPRITSHFNPKRMHPVLHVVRPHNGTDFGGGRGTPVYATRYGKVALVGPHGASGNLVLLDHANGIRTGYAHLSRFAPGLKAGQKVDTRQLIGFIGSTGRSTGPHLHFSVKKNGKFINPLSLNLDSQRSVPSDHRGDYNAFRAEMDPLLDGISVPGGDAGDESGSGAGGDSSHDATKDDDDDTGSATASNDAKHDSKKGDDDDRSNDDDDKPSKPSRGHDASKDDDEDEKDDDEKDDDSEDRGAKASAPAPSRKRGGGLKSAIWHPPGGLVRRKYLGGAYLVGVPGRRSRAWRS